MKNKYLIAGLVAVMMLYIPSRARASEGFFELRNQVGQPSICHITSGIMEDQEFRLLTLCRDIIYPGGTEVFRYVAWASPLDGGNPIKLGEIGLGKKIYSTKEPFNRVFVTRELDGDVRTPTGQVVMQGDFQPIRFLTSAQNTPSNEQTPPTDTEVTQPTPTPNVEADNSQNSRNLFRTIALGGVLAFLAIFGIVLVIFIVSRR